MLICSKDENAIKKVINYLKENTSLGEEKFFLNTEISRKEGGSYLLSQKSKINQLLKDFQFEEANHHYTYEN